MQKNSRWWVLKTTLQISAANQTICLSSNNTFCQGWDKFKNLQNSLVTFLPNGQRVALTFRRLVVRTLSESFCFELYLYFKFLLNGVW